MTKSLAVASNNTLEKTIALKKLDIEETQSLLR